MKHQISISPCIVGKNACKDFGKGPRQTCGEFLLLPSAEVTSSDNRYLTNDVLNVHVELITQGDLVNRVNENNKRKIPIEEKFQQRNLQIGKMFTNSISTDLAVKGPSKSFGAHKCVLAGNIIGASKGGTFWKT